MKRFIPDVTDLHIYGGALLVAGGFGMLATWAAPVALGLTLLALGLKRA